MEGENFKGDFTPEGVLKLQERLREKLRDLVGDYSDETLVEYVIVLLKNGRSKDEASKELHVFLGNHSIPFISWLWDHLSSNLHLYSQNEPIDNDKDGVRKPSRNRHKRDNQKEIFRKEIFPLRSVVTHILHGEDRNKDNTKQPKSPNDIKKRMREDESQPRKRGPIINVSNRLLQSAVRDAVKPIHRAKTEYSSPKEEYSSSKRLHSVVLASPLNDSTTRSSSRSVFDRLTKVTSSLLTSSNFDDRYEESKHEDFDNKVDENDEMSESDKEMEIISPDAEIKMPQNEDFNKVESASINEDASKEVSSSCEVSEAVGEMEGPVSTAMEKPKVEKVPPKPSSIQVPTSYTTSQSLYDVDSRSVFITNVNFAATKDALSRHFNKFGAVLKVVILSDPTTGQPTGSACVEFLHKESAELALSVNGTSFMSRIVKVVRKNSPEAAQYLGWCSTTSRGGRVGSLGLYPGGVASFRGRPPIRTGARSLQWKRGASSAVQPPPALIPAQPDLIRSFRGDEVLVEGGESSQID